MASTHKRHEWRGYGGDSGAPEERKEKGKQGPCGPLVFTGECAPVRATEYLGMTGDLVSMGWERSGDHKMNSEPRESPLILPRCWQNVDLEIRKVKSGEGQAPGQKEE